MNFTEFRLLIGSDWGLMLLSCILLYMFITRLRRRGGFLGITGTAATTLLLLLLVWLQWNKYTVGQQILDIASQEGAGYHLLTEDRTPMVLPEILHVNGVRYVIDKAQQHQKRYLPWKLIAIPK